MFIESLTISGFLEVDDRSFKFNPRLNVHNNETNLICEALRWFINCSGTEDFRLQNAVTENSCIEIRLRTIKQNVKFFRRLRGRRQDCDSEDTLVCLRRFIRNPHTLQVDDCFRISFDQFKYTMEAFGFCFRTEQVPSLNIIGQQELSERIFPINNLWEIVLERLQVSSFQRQQNEDQNVKSYLRRKLNSTMLYDNQEKIDEFRDRIESGKQFRKLQDYLDTMAGAIARKELETYKNVLKIYETELTEILYTNEKLDERCSILSHKLDKKMTAIPEMCGLMVEDFTSEYFLTKLGQTKIKCLQQRASLSWHTEYQIKDLMKKMLANIGEILHLKANIDNLMAHLVDVECEVEYVEKLMNLSSVLSVTDQVAVDEYYDSLSVLVKSTKSNISKIDNELLVLLEEIESCRSCITASSKFKQQDAPLRRGGELIIKLENEAQEFVRLSLSVLQLNKDLFEKQNLITSKIDLMDFFSPESINGMATLKYFIATSDVAEYETNFVGFVFEHLRFTNVNVTDSALPYLKELLTLAVFRKRESMMQILKALPSSQSYSVLAMDGACDDAPLSHEMPPTVFPLVELLSGGPIRSVMKKVLRNYYYSYENPGITEIPAGLTVIYLHDNLAVGDGGAFTGGYTTAGGDLLCTMVDTVNLTLETIDLKRKLHNANQTVLQKKQRMREIEAELLALEVDTFERFDKLHQTYSNWSTVPSLLEQLAKQQKSLVFNKTLSTSCEKLLELIAGGQFELENRESYKQKLADLKNSQIKPARELGALETKYYHKIAQLKWDIRALAELLTHAEAVRQLTVLPEIGRQLVNFWADFGTNLQGELDKLEIEIAEEYDWAKLENELDRLERNSQEPQRLLATYNERLQETDRFYQELCSQMNKYQLAKAIPRRKGNLQQLYEYKLQLNNTQPGYKEHELKWFQYKLKLLLEDEHLVANYRTVNISNLTLPTIEKMFVTKLRLITEMMAGIPTFLGLSGTVSLVLHFPKDALPPAAGNSEQSKFSIKNAVGLSIKFVDHNLREIGAETNGVLGFAHFLFFVCFLSSEGCKFLLLPDWPSELDESSEKSLLEVLGLFSRNMQIFVTRKHNQ